MLILALDTTTRAGSVAVVRDQTVLAELSGNPELTHGQRLPADLMQVVSDAGVRLEEVELFAVAAGPGSFTGLRIGIATMQGLAMARGRLIVAVPTLEALARSVDTAGRPVAAWMDAHRGEVFGALYEPGGRIERVAAASLLPEALLRAWAEAGIADAMFVGDGATRYREIIREMAGQAAGIIEPPRLAGVIGRIASQESGRAVVPHAVVPIYVRQPDAELARARREQAR
jgi:tRNA threonylcarbamoyladenosine biosynthesis protein TsaB